MKKTSKYILSNNIRYLRCFMGESQEDLANAINNYKQYHGLLTFSNGKQKQGHDKSSIARFENGERKPSSDDLQAIATHYCIAVDDLLYKDLESIKYIQGVKRIDIGNLIMRLLPPIITVNTTENDSVNQAFKCHKKIVSIFENENVEDDLDDLLDTCFSIYSKEIKDNMYSAACNYLWLYTAFGIFFVPVITRGFMFEKNEQDITLKETLPFHDLNNKYSIRFNSDISEQCQKALNDYISVHTENVDLCLYVLKNSGDTKYVDIMLYYIAFLSFFGLLNENTDVTEQRKNGINLMNILHHNLKNKYALIFYAELCSHLGIDFNAL